MDNQDIHKQLDRPEVRDFLAQEYEQSMRDAQYQSPESVKAEVARLKAEIEKLQGLLIHAQRYQAVCELLEGQGWKAWDISDEVPYNQETYFPFVGTEEEMQALWTHLEEDS